MTSPPRRGSRLYELLEEPQAPFLLDVCLDGNGQRDTGFWSLQAAILCWSCTDVPRILPRLTSLGFKRRRGGFGKCVKIIKKALHCAPEKPKFSISSCLRRMGSQTHTGGFKRLYYPSGISEGVTHGEVQPSNCDSQEQLSPVSILDLHTEEAAAAATERPANITFNSQAKQALGIIRELLACSCYPSLSEHAEISNIEWHQNKKLLLDCMEEMEEMTWGSGKRITELVASEFSRTRKQWSHHQCERQEIGAEIASVIFEELREEVVRGILGSNCTSERC